MPVYALVVVVVVVVIVVVVVVVVVVVSAVEADVHQQACLWSVAISSA